MGPLPGPNGFPSWKCPQCGEVCEGVGPVTLTIARLCHMRDTHGAPDPFTGRGRALRPFEPPKQAALPLEPPKREALMTPLQQLADGEPWRCSCCGELMYNVDEKRDPAPGAPTSKWFSDEYKRCCSVCYQMLLNLIGEDRKGYWQDLDRAEKEWNRKEQERLKKLRPGNDYFAGA